MITSMTSVKKQVEKYLLWLEYMGIVKKRISLTFHVV